jgi:N-methylhydantoinase B
MTIDPVTLSVIGNALTQITDEMDLAQEKTAFSSIISEARDRANGIYHRENGEVIAQGRRGLPLFVGVMQATTRAVIDRDLGLVSGDVVIVNDPYLGGTHLMDVKCVRPFFYRGELWCYLANSAHWADTGGFVPGGFASSATEIQQEGLRIPPTRIVRAGTYDQEIVDLVLANCRVPLERLGDLRSQVGALSVGERRLTALLDRYGRDTVDAAIIELRARSARQMRAHISDITDGTYEFTCWIDSDGVVNEPLRIALSMTVSGSELAFDLSGSSPPCKGPMNTPWATTQTGIYIAVMHMFPDVPINAGCFDPISIVEPRGSFLYAEYPRPCSGAAAEVSQRVCEAALGALGTALPERAVAGAFGTAGNISIGGYDPGKERAYVMYYFTGGGYGGNWAGDGHSNAVNLIAFAKSQPFEVLEKAYPVLFSDTNLREGSAGAGRSRGGLGVSYRATLRRGTATVSFMMDKGRIPPHGIMGGGSGAPTEIEISQGGRIVRPEHYSKGNNYPLAPGDWVMVRTPGGGGLGAPAERDPAAIARDVRRGYLTAEAAARDYGWHADADRENSAAE